MGLSNFIYRFKYRYAKSLNLSKPVDISLELASLCNQACGYCYHADTKNLPFTKALMEKWIAIKAIEDAASLGVHSIKFNYRGESTLNPHFYELTTVAKENANGMTFIDRLTNSNFKFSHTNYQIFMGLANQTKVKISLDSFVPNVMETQRAGSNLEVALRNIDRFYNWPNRKTEIVIQAVRTQLNKDEDIAGEVKKRWPEATCNINDMVSGRVDKDLTKYEVKDRDFSNRQSCVQAHARMIVLHDGLVQMCCPDIGSKLIIGDIKTQSIRQIWNSSKAIEIRESLKNKTAFENDPCKSCPSHESFKGWRAKWQS